MVPPALFSFAYTAHTRPARIPCAVLIFVADDDADSRGLLRMVLEGEGYEVREFCEGGALVSALSGETPAALVVTDLLMPGGGLEMLSAMALLPALPPLIIVSAVEAFAPPDPMPAVAAYLVKPVNGQELRAAVRAVIGSMSTPRLTEADLRAIERLG